MRRKHRVSTPRNRERELRAIEGNTRVVQVLLALIGVAAFALFFLLVPDRDNKGFWVETSYFLGTALISGSLIAYIVGRASIYENEVRSELAVERAIDRSLRGISADLATGSSREYRWQTFLTAPEADCPHQDYAVQYIGLSRTVTEISDEVHVLCIASDGDEISRYADDQRYLLRWAVDPVLDPCSPIVFEILTVQVNGIPLQQVGERTEATELGTSCADYAFSVPAVVEHDLGIRVDLWVKVRKHMGDDARLRLRTQVFAPTLGAEFLCAIDGSLPCAKMYAYTGELTPIGPKRSPVVAPAPSVDRANGGMRFISVRYDGFLEEGSAVAFHVERELASERRSPG